MKEGLGESGSAACRPSHVKRQSTPKLSVNEAEIAIVLGLGKKGWQKFTDLDRLACLSQFTEKLRQRYHLLFTKFTFAVFFYRL